MSNTRPVEKRVLKSAVAPDWQDPISPAVAWERLIFCSGELGADPATLKPIADAREKARTETAAA